MSKRLLDLSKAAAFEQYQRRKKFADEQPQINNRDLYAGSPMHFYCIYCGIETEVLPEDYLFPPLLQCSQCVGLEQHGWLEEAVELGLMPPKELTADIDYALLEKSSEEDDIPF